MTEALAQTVLQMGMTNYQSLRSYAVTQLRILYSTKHGWAQVTHFSVTHFIPSLRTPVMQILLRVLYVGRYAVYVRCGTVLGRCDN